MRVASFAAIFFLTSIDLFAQVYLPIEVADRRTPSNLKLTSIGKFGILRKARPGIPAHLHTGIDIQRPRPNYVDEPIFPVSAGVVISKRDDGAYAQLIIEHQRNGYRYWTVYEHIAGIVVNVNDEVDPMKPIARFMNKAELNRYGWQFDHFHFEVLKKMPRKLKRDREKPQRYFQSYTLECYNESNLEAMFISPIEFFLGK